MAPGRARLAGPHLALDRALTPVPEGKGQLTQVVTSWKDQGKKPPTILAQKATMVSMTEATMWTIPATLGHRLPKEGGQSASRMDREQLPR